MTIIEKQKIVDDLRQLSFDLATYEVENPVDRDLCNKRIYAVCGAIGIITEVIRNDKQKL